MLNARHGRARGAAAHTYMLQTMGGLRTDLAWQDLFLTSIFGEELYAYIGYVRIRHAVRLMLPSARSPSDLVADEMDGPSSRSTKYRPSAGR